MAPKFITVKETAKMVRKALKAQFKGQKFSVRMDGKSIRVEWVDGPNHAQVKTVVSIFEGAQFDGMRDIKSYKTHWMSPDGTLQPTKEQNEIFEIVDTAKPHPEAVEIHFHADYIFTTRKYTPELVQSVIDKVQSEYGFDYIPQTWEYDGYASMADDRQEANRTANHYYHKALDNISA